MNTKTHALIILMVLSLLLRGCSGIPVANLKPVSPDLSMELVTDYAYEEYFRIPRTWLRYSASAGLFRSIGSDEAGVYFIGPSQCIRVFASEPDAPRDFPSSKQVGRALDCGIFLPFNKNDPARLFTFIGGDAKPVKDDNLDGTTFPTAFVKDVPTGIGTGIGFGLAKAFAEIERGNINFLASQPNDESLRSVFIRR